VDVRIPYPRRGAGAAVAAACLLALAFAGHARAADLPSPVAPSAPDAPAVVMPTAPVAPTAVQSAPANLVVSVRIDSPGDDGAVTQAVTATAASTETAAPTTAAPAPDAAPVAAQTSPENVRLSIRIGSPGNDGATTQTIAAGAQYQPAAGGAAAPAPAPDSAQAPAAPQVEAASVPAGRSALPSTWLWTWTCGDIAGADTTSALDITSSAWIWNMKLGDSCAGASQSMSNDDLIGDRKLLTANVVAPTLPSVILPTPPAVVAPQAPQQPETAVLQLEPGASAQGERVVAGAGGGGGGPPARRPVVAHAFRPPPALRAHPAAFLHVLSSGRTAAPAAAGERQPPAHEAAAQKARPPSPRPARRLPSGDGFDPVPAGPSGGAASGSAGASPGVTAALALSLLLLLPALAVMRLPRSLRRPGTRVDEVPTRPG
jgi:hypothetical protein